MRSSHLKSRCVAAHAIRHIDAYERPCIGTDLHPLKAGKQSGRIKVFPMRQKILKIGVCEIDVVFQINKVREGIVAEKLVRNNFPVAPRKMPWIFQAAHCSEFESLG